MARKVIQISNIDNDGCYFRALCDDGSMWEASWAIRGEDKTRRWHWDSITNVPQEIMEEKIEQTHNSKSAPGCVICGCNISLNGYCAGCQTRVD